MKLLILIAYIFSLSRAANGLVINAHDGSNEKSISKNANDAKINEFIKNEEFLLKQDNLIATLSLEKEYSISFQIKPKSYIKKAFDEFQSVIYLVTDTKPVAIMQRFPGVWFGLFDGRGSGGITFPVNSENQFEFYEETFETDKLPLNKWTSIRFSQTELDGLYTFYCYVNGRVIKSFENQYPNSFKDVKVYLADPWNDVQDASIKNFKIVNGKTGIMDTTVPNIKRLAYQSPRNLKKTTISNNKRSTHRCDNPCCKIKRSIRNYGKC
uniref:Stalk protein n=1 Tax=Hydra oligactis TaxID=6088 RepID=B3VQ05_HYDOL|nr:stalk protein [Hydra oligactis]